MPRTRLRPGDDSGAGAQQVLQTAPIVAPYPDMLPFAPATAFPPCGRRGLWLVVVGPCEQCGGYHHHRVHEAARLFAGRLLRRCPSRRGEHVLAPVLRRRETRRG